MASYPGWERALLRLIGAPVTPNNVRSLRTWQRYEGGSANFNPLNTTLHTRGSVGSYNSAGVQRYQNPLAGSQATAQTLLGGHYGRIVRDLRRSANPGETLSAVNASPWGTHISGVSSAGPAFGGVPLREHGFSSRANTNPQVRQELVQSLMQGFAGISQHKAPDFASEYQLIGQLHGQGRGTGDTLSSSMIPVYSQGPTTPRDRQVVQLAGKFLGTPYVWGGSRPGGFDCSGLLQYVWGQKGIRIPRTTYDQFRVGRPVSASNLRPGDAVFFRGSDSKGGLPGHVGMYIGGGKFIEAPHTGARVRISYLRGRSDFVGARRYG